MFCTTSFVISIARIMETPESSSEDIVRVVRAVFNSLDRLPTIGSLTTIKSMYFFIKPARKSKIMPMAEPIIKIKDKNKCSEKKLPKKIINLVETGSCTPSSLKVLARVGTTKANIKTPIKTIAERITPGYIRAPRIFLVKECDFSKFMPISERAPERLPDSSPARVIETKSFEKTSGNFSSPEESVPPAFISLESDVKILSSVVFFVCFFKTDNALKSESPARSIPLKFLVKIICSSAFTLEKMRPKIDERSKKLLLFSVMD